MRRSKSLALLVVIGAVSLVALFTKMGTAAYWELDQPGVAFAATYPQADRDRVRAVLAAKKYKYVHGFAINSFTTLTYRGDTRALNSFLEELAACREVTIHVSFERPANSGHYLHDVDWAVHHQASENRFQVKINLASANIDLPSLYLPEIHSKGE